MSFIENFANPKQNQKSSFFPLYTIIVENSENMDKQREENNL